MGIYRGRGDGRIPVTAKATPIISLRCLAALVIAGCAMPVAGQDSASGYAGSAVCGKCHAAQFESQSKTAHAHALRPAQATDAGPGSHSQWAFGAGGGGGFLGWLSRAGGELRPSAGRVFR